MSISLMDYNGNIKSLLSTSPTYTANQQVGPHKDTTFTKIFVGGLPYHTTDDSLRSYFEKFGEIEEAVVITDRQTGKSRGYGFVTMSRSHEASRAISDPNPCIDGRKANVNLAILGAKPRILPGANVSSDQLQRLLSLQTAAGLYPIQSGYQFAHGLTGSTAGIIGGNSQFQSVSSAHYPSIECQPQQQHQQHQYFVPLNYGLSRSNQLENPSPRNIDVTQNLIGHHGGSLGQSGIPVAAIAANQQNLAAAYALHQLQSGTSLSNGSAGVNMSSNLNYSGLLTSVTSPNVAQFGVLQNKINASSLQ